MKRRAANRLGPPSVTDRPSSAVEYVYLLTKQARYFWDSENYCKMARDRLVKDAGMFAELASD